MKAVVYKLKGNLCTAPGCGKPSETLDHREPWAYGGLTSVENLFPMCTECNTSKGTKDYEDWLLDREVDRILRRVTTKTR